MERSSPHPEPIPSPEDYRKVFESANEHRDYGLYADRMDAVTDEKANTIFPHVRRRAGGTIVDAGGGTGALAERMAHEFSDMRVVTLDISPELLRKSGLNKLSGVCFRTSGKDFRDNFVPSIPPQPSVNCEAVFDL